VFERYLAEHVTEKDEAGSVIDPGEKRLREKVGGLEVGFKQLIPGFSRRASDRRWRE